MRTRIALLSLGLTLSIVYINTEVRAETPPPAEKAAVKLASPPGPPPSLAPFTDGKAIRITRLFKNKPLEIVVPKNVKLKMLYLDSDDILPRANLLGGSLNIELEQPEGGFMTFAFQTKPRDNGVTVLRAEETADGYLVLDRSAGSPPTFGVLVSRPKLGVICSQSQIKTIGDAELAGTVCLSLRAATAK